MRVRLDYGDSGVEAEFPDDRTTVIEPDYPSGVGEPSRALRAAIERPLGSSPLSAIVRPGQKVAISVCDGTRPKRCRTYVRPIS